MSHFQISAEMAVVSNVDLYTKMSADSTRNLEDFQGENSTIHELTLNDGHVFILKKNERRGYNIQEEAQLQQYATSAHAPRVYAFDKDKILMEKCAPLQEIHHKTFGLMENGVQLFQFREKVFQFNAISRALAASRLLTRTKALYDDFGLFSTDVHRGNFLQRAGGAIVQIDFDEMKFQTATQYTTFQKLYPGKHTTRVLTNAPKDPPHYYWWADSILNEKDQKSWPRQKWLDEIVTMKQLYRDIEDEIHSFLEETLQKRQIRLHSRVKETQGRSSLRQARPTSQV